MKRQNLFKHQTPTKVLLANEKPLIGPQATSGSICTGRWVTDRVFASSWHHEAELQRQDQSWTLANELALNLHL